MKIMTSTGRYICNTDCIDNLEANMEANGWVYDPDTDCICKKIEKEYVTPTGKKYIEKDTINVFIGDLCDAVTVHYGDYKRNYRSTKTLKDSYSAEDKTIVVLLPLWDEE